MYWVGLTAMKLLPAKIIIEINPFWFKRKINLNLQNEGGHNEGHKITWNLDKDILAVTL